MKIWFDTEFIDDGKSIELISIGMVREDGAQYYAENAECDLSRACEWVQKNVVPHLTGPKKSREQMKQEVVAFAGFRPEFWTYFGAYDWVVLAQFFGRMMDLPTEWPMHPMDIQQERVLHGIFDLPKQEGRAHNALDDAIWTRDAYYYIFGNRPNLG